MITVDSYFTSIMFVEVSNYGFAVVGLARENRFGNCSIETIENLREKKKERGAINYRKDLSPRVIIELWKGNSVVTTLSNCTLVNPLGSAKR
ncbi:hypothetical protein X975_01723, partial [Stegodyphus mimosarum]